MTIADILSGSEQQMYGAEEISVDMANKQVFVISDLHLAAGLNANGNYDGTENFFADRSFFRFLTHIKNNILPGRKAILIINGDFVDFLRIRNIPSQTADFQIWSNLLKDLGINKSVSELQGSISKKEVEYGLRTDDYKSVWKLYTCFIGHQCVFESLGKWLSQGNELIIVKGNHDLEWVWKKVRDYLRLILARNVSTVQGLEPGESLQNIVTPQMMFVDDKLVIEKKIYLEHGHRYERFTAVDGPALLNNGTELNLPFGSFFNRYLINRIELAYPYIDDVRPRKKLLPLLIRERFPLAVKVLFKYIPFVFLVIPKKQYLYALKYLMQFFWIIGVPIIVTVFVIWRTLPHPFHFPTSTGSTSAFWQLVLPQIKNLAFLSLSYFIGRIFSIFSLSAPSSFFPDAKIIFDAYDEVDFVSFGHTHDPEQKMLAGKFYYNTGTWIPVYELDAANVRMDKTYTFLHFFKNEFGKIQTEGLMRWNDDAGRSEGMELRDTI